MSANIHFCAVIILETLASGEDQGLEAAHVHFHKAVEQKRGVIFNTTLANVQNIGTSTTWKLRPCKISLRPDRPDLGVLWKRQKASFHILLENNADLQSARKFHHHCPATLQL